MSASRTERTCSNGVLACTGEAAVCPVQPYSLHCNALHQSTALCQNVRTHQPKVNKLGWKFVSYSVLQPSSGRADFGYDYIATNMLLKCTVTSLSDRLWIFVWHAELWFNPFTTTCMSRLCLIGITGSQQGSFSWMERCSEIYNWRYRLD